MKPIEVTDPLAQSADLTAEKIDQLHQLFPEAITEDASGRKVDFEVLRRLLGDAVTESDEKYGLNWHGKRAARRLALTPSTGTLRPSPEDSVDWDTTQNLMIEGDNLEVLKLLQKSYTGKVKMIYIDPPYNTGKDFVYKDNFTDSIGNYLRQTQQVDSEGAKVTTNSETSGRFHTDWLNMMYPRLMLARNLLRDDGVIFISIDDGEQSNIRRLCDDVFGEENFVEQIIWKKRSTPPNDQIIGANHDYILVFAKSAEKVGLNLRARTKEQQDRYTNPDNHPKGPWTSGDLMANVKGGRYVASLNFGIVNPNTGEEHFPSSDGNWRFNKARIAELLENDEIHFGEDGKGRPKLKRFLCEVKDGVTYPTIWDFVPLNTAGSSEMASLLGNMNAFDNPKPRHLLTELIKLGGTDDGIILDFFAGSGTVGDAIFHANRADGGTRKFILVQLPQPTLSGEFKAVSDITVRRLRAAAKELRSNSMTLDGDLGFRIFKLDTTNVRPWNPTLAVTAESLPGLVDNILPGRSEKDLLYELLLKRGLELTVPIEAKQIADKQVYAVGAGTLIACLAPAIAASDVEALADGIITWHKELAPDPAPNPETPKARPAKIEPPLVVFRDNAFVDDVAKSNLTEILKQHGLTDVRSL